MTATSALKRCVVGLILLLVGTALAVAQPPRGARRKCSMTV
ncbi:MULTISPECIES: hypothetical protein [unclassified Bradyrhizobium]|nr:MULTISPECIES: hypothetical protein [unclassified Bradyrhizobium]